MLNIGGLSIGLAVAMLIGLYVRDELSFDQFNQKADFKSLGGIGDWDNPYKTMDFATEGATVKTITEIARHGYLQQGYKPVHWCLDCESALAEAEVEYADLKSPSLYVGFRVVSIRSF